MKYLKTGNPGSPIASLVFSLLLLAGLCSFAQAQPPNAAPQPRPADARAEIRSYHFEDTGEELPYALYVSSKVKPQEQSPLIIALHGLGGSHTSLVRDRAIDLAEEHGYILVGPMGYNSRGWYGIPDVPDLRGDAETDPANRDELSEKDVMNVLAMVREEFNIDDKRIYLMGHSMGGAGTLYLGVKHEDIWAAIAAIAPAAFWVDPQSLVTVPDMPVFIVHGTEDTVVQVDVSHRFVNVLQANEMDYEFQEIPDGDHGSVIPDGMPGIYDFFGKHKREQR